MPMPVKGTYCLCIENHSDQVIKVGALGEIDFTKGTYVYIGSALNSLIPRLKRHQRTSIGEQNVIHWHIDYLLNNEEVELTAIYTIESGEPLECRIAKRVARHGTPVPRFGCSDCKCSSHLYKVDDLDFITEIGLKKWA